MVVSRPEIHYRRQCGGPTKMRRVKRCTRVPTYYLFTFVPCPGSIIIQFSEIIYVCLPLTWLGVSHLCRLGDGVSLHQLRLAFCGNRVGDIGMLSLSSLRWRSHSLRSLTIDASDTCVQGPATFHVARLFCLVA